MIVDDHAGAIEKAFKEFDRAMMAAEEDEIDTKLYVPEGPYKEVRESIEIEVSVSVMVDLT